MASAIHLVGKQETLRAFAAYAAATRKSIPEIHRKFGINLAFKALNKTPQANKGKWPISPDAAPKRKGKSPRAKKGQGVSLAEKRKVWKAKAAAIASSKVSRPPKFGKSRDKKRLYFAKANKAGFHKGNGNADAARKIYGQRRSSVGYTAAAWGNVAASLGASVRMRVTGRSQGRKSKAVLTDGEGARPTSRFTNHAPAAEKIGTAAMKAAAVEALADMEKYGGDQLRKAAIRASGKIGRFIGGAI